MIRATHETTAGQRYLELQREARRTGRPTDELIQLYALECFLDRLVRSRYAENFVLKGGVLLAALDARRPTRDIDLAASALNSQIAAMLDVIREIAAMTLDDGLVFDMAKATAEVIREESNYSGVRVTLGGTLSRASIHLHVDINVGDPIWPAPQSVRVPRLLAGTLIVRGYPLEMVLAEKIVTAIARGTANTRWRDFLDIYTLVQRHSIDGTTLKKSMLAVAKYREVMLVPLKPALAGYGAIAQQRWSGWLKKQRLEFTTPANFSALLDAIAAFADPVIINEIAPGVWGSENARWSHSDATPTP